MITKMRHDPQVIAQRALAKLQRRKLPPSKHDVGEVVRMVISELNIDERLYFPSDIDELRYRAVLLVWDFAKDMDQATYTALRQRYDSQQDKKW